MLKNSIQIVNTEHEWIISNTNTQFFLLCVTPLYFPYSISYNKDLAMMNRFRKFSMTLTLRL